MRDLDVSIQKYRMINKREYDVDQKTLKLKGWINRVGNIQTARYILSYGTDENQSDAPALEVYNFINEMFVQHGFSENEAMEYMNKNKELFRIRRSYIISVLSLLRILKLDDEAFFEHPDFFLKDYSLQDIYNGVNIQKKATYEMSMLDFKLVMYLRDRQQYESDKKLSNVRRMLLEKTYIEQLIAKNEQKRVLE